MNLNYLSNQCCAISSIKYNNPFVHPSIYGHLALNNCCNYIFTTNEVCIDSINFIINEIYHYSISHTDEYAAAVIDTHKIGIDCLKIEQRVFMIKEKFLNKQELLLVGDTLENLTKAFTLKEAAIKCFNLSLVDLNEIVIKNIGNIYSLFSYKETTYTAYHTTVDNHVFTLVRKNNV